MKKKENTATELVFILDRSGSREGLESDTIGGFNNMLKKHQEKPGECRITTVLFDNEYEILHDRLDIKTVEPITDRDYFVRGTTALLDAVGTTINRIDGEKKKKGGNDRTEKVMVIITTDGMENASHEFNYNAVKAMIEQHKEKHGWEFIFLGANIDAAAEAQRIGISANRAQSFHNDSVGVALNYEVLAETSMMFRAASTAASIPADWDKKIQEDFTKRKK
jgi:uncharacterized protein YegL